MTLGLQGLGFEMTEETDYTFDGAAIPDVLAHFGRVSGCSGGVRALMIAVFEDGMRCFMSPDDEIRAEAEEWVTSNERGYVFAFLTICDTLDMDGGAVREALISSREKTGFVARRAIRTRPNVRQRGCLRPNRRRNRSRKRSADAVEEPLRQAVNA